MIVKKQGRFSYTFSYAQLFLFQSVTGFVRFVVLFSATSLYTKHVYNICNIIYTQDEK